MANSYEEIVSLCYNAKMLLALGLTFLIGSQDIPKNVRYKRGPEPVNKKAADRIAKVLAAKPEVVDFTGLSDDVVICGPGLWGRISKAIPKNLAGMKPVTFMVPNSTGVQKLEGRMFKTAEAKEMLWIAVVMVAKSPGKYVVRKGKANEISYYWSIISYDIEEPLLFADTPKAKLLFHFSVEHGHPKVFFVDAVMDKAKG